MNVATLLAIAAGRLTIQITRRLRLGGGTAFPGLLALRIAPSFLATAGRALPHGTILIAGTNGKTTTARLLAGTLESIGLTIVHNRSGSNLPRGVAATLLETIDWSGTIHRDLGIFEVDEFALPAIAQALRPRLLVLLNLFRDQLDRYGELETIVRLWERTLDSLPPETLLVVDADDPILAALTERFADRRWTFGLADPRIALPALPHAADWRSCPRCGAPLAYEQVFLGHLGAYRCTACPFARPPLTVAGRCVRMEQGTLAVETVYGERELVLQSQLTGVYNAYNVLAAATASLAVGLAPEQLVAGLAGVTAAFGRQERVELAGRTVTLLLVKNPTGFNEAIRLIASATQPQPILILINDLDADGRDVSWLWDVDLEPLRALEAPVSTGGIRGADMALRLAYAGIAPVHQFAGVASALDRWVETLPPGSCGWVLATYTALLELRRELGRRGLAREFWRQ